VQGRLVNGSAVWKERSLAFLLAAVTGSVLAVAVWLDPDPAGLGTHQQLGLGRCGFLSWTGWPCAMCGMTTTFALAVEGRWLESAVNQPFGFVLVLITFGLFLIAVLDMVHPRRRMARFGVLLGRHDRPIAGFLLVGLVAGWLYKAHGLGVF
jgi:hypothetical protein